MTWPMKVTCDDPWCRTILGHVFLLPDLEITIIGASRIATSRKRERSYFWSRSDMTRSRQVNHPDKLTKLLSESLGGNAVTVHGPRTEKEKRLAKSTY